MDEKLLLLINREWTHPALDRVMAAVSSFDVWSPFVAIAALALLIKGSFRMRAFLVVAGIVIGFNDGIVSRITKRMVDRPRPHQSHSNVRMVDLSQARPRLLALAKPLKIKNSQSSLEDVVGRSFPSSHTMNTTALAITAVAFFGWAASWMFIVPALVAYSRIYTGSHWPSDVFTSLFLGAGATFLILALANPLWRLLAVRFWPALGSRHPDLFVA